jgi:Sec-independent protein secretion pathway component TatC
VGDAPPALNSGTVEVIRVPQWRDSMIAQEFRLTTYVNFVLLLLLGIVIAFQMPLVIVLMGWLGLVTAGGLRAKRKYAFFVCAAVAAVITPADALSMLMMLVPLVALFELSILLLVLAPAASVAEGTILKRFRPRRPD